MLITRRDDGYFGLRRSLDGVFDKAVCSWLVNGSEEHVLIEDRKTVAPFSRISVPQAFRSQQRKHSILRSIHHYMLADSLLHFRYLVFG